MFRPNILANRHADFFAVEIERLDAGGRLKITVFVEDVVGRQKRFVRFANRLAADQQSSRVMKRSAASFVSIDESNEQRRFADTAMKLIQDLERFRNKARFEDQVLRWITGDREFGRDNELGSIGSQAFVKLEDLLEITPQIPHGGIELGEADFHPAN